MKKKILMSLILLAIIGASVVYAQQPTLDKLKFASTANGTAWIVTPANKQITGAVVIPANHEGKPVTTIGLFTDVTGITSVVIPDSVTTFAAGSGTFRGCTGITSATIGTSVATIPSNFFRGCTDLTSVIIPATVTRIGEWAFSDCTSLTSVTLQGQTTIANTSSFPGDLRAKFIAANGGPGVYTRTAGSNTWTKQSSIAYTPPAPVNTSLNGVWEISGGGLRITISDNTGTFTSITTTDATWLDAINKGYVKVGDQYLRNIRSTGNLTWSGESLRVRFNQSSPNVATGTTWGNCTITMNADGRTFDLSGMGTFTRQ